MAHFARVENGVVTDVIVIRNEDCGGGVFPSSEPAGQAFIAALAAHDPALDGDWFQTSRNTHDGLHYGPDSGWEMVGFEVKRTNGHSEGAFRWTYGQVGFTFNPSVGEYGEFRSPEESA